MTTTPRATAKAAKAAAPVKKAAAEKAAPVKAMNRAELVTIVAEQGDLPKAKADAVLDAVFSAIEGALKQKQEVRLTGFGTFSLTSRKATTGRNPRTGEAIDIPESTSVRFKPGKTLKGAVG